MKKSMTFVMIISLIITFFSCAEVKKQIALDDLVGTYLGSPHLVIQWSKLNIGIDDQLADDNKSEYVILIKDSQDNLFIKFDDGMKVRLNNVQAASNGAVFNIPEQDISMKSDGSTISGTIAGLQENYFGEAKCDGFYNTENNKLSFSFSGTISFNEGNIVYDVPIAVAYYDFVKQNK